MKNDELAQSRCTACRAALEGRATFLFHTDEGSWPAILVANLLAATTMTAYFRLRHPNMRIRP